MTDSSTNSDGHLDVIVEKPPFGQIPVSLTRDTSLSFSARVIYDDLVSRADNTGRDTYPEMRTIAEDVGASTSTVAKAIRDLEAAGWVTVRRGARRPDGTLGRNQYVVHWRPVAENDTGDPVAENATSLSRKTASTSRGNRDGTRPTHSIPIELDPSSEDYPTVMKDAIVAAMGWNPTDVTRNQWGKIEAAGKQLRDVGADPAEVPRRAMIYRMIHPQWELTPTALVSHWADVAEDRVTVPATALEKALWQSEYDRLLSDQKTRTEAQRIADARRR